MVNGTHVLQLLKTQLFICQNVTHHYHQSFDFINVDENKLCIRQKILATIHIGQFI